MNIKEFIMEALYYIGGMAALLAIGIIALLVIFAIHDENERNRY